MDKLLFIIKVLTNKKFTGNLHITFYNGGVAQIRRDIQEVYDLKSVPTITVEEFVAKI
jgi:hypothetical protein